MPRKAQTKSRAYTRAARTLNPVATPQIQPVYGKAMIQNEAGGYGFEVDKWTRLERFLILGTEGGNYYTGEQKLTIDATQNVIACIKEDGKRAVDTIVQISDAGRAAKNDPAIFALALAASSDTLDTRQYALQALPKVVRIGTHLFHFVEYIDKLRGWSRSLRTAVANWYTNRKDDQLAMQLTKYQARDGWSHRDVLRLAHPVPQTEAQALAFKWAVERYHAQKDKNSNRYDLKQFGVDTENLSRWLPLIHAYEEMKAADNEKDILRLIRDYKLPLELVPTEKRTAAVYEEVIPNLGITALIRQLPTLTRAGILGDMGNTNTKEIVAKITNEELLKKGRVHPYQILLALATYRNGHSFRGDATWTPIRKLVDALDDAFYLSFGTVTPTGKRMLLALDVSGSMGGGPVLGSEQLKPCEVTAAMSMVTARVEEDWMVMGFAHDFRKLDISPKQRLSDVMQTVVRNDFGGTDCSLPMVYATQHKIPVDAFVVYTDNETWYGSIHPFQALKNYQQKMGIGAKLISVATSVNKVTIAEESSRTMNIVGFDSNAPHIISDFVSH
jgi:60 kDa SS-A/Ro ribonucleoprotein